MSRHIYDDDYFSDDNDEGGQAHLASDDDADASARRASTWARRHLFGLSGPGDEDYVTDDDIGDDDEDYYDDEDDVDEDEDMDLVVDEDEELAEALEDLEQDSQDGEEPATGYSAFLQLANLIEASNGTVDLDHPLFASLLSGSAGGTAGGVALSTLMNGLARSTRSARGGAAPTTGRPRTAQDRYQERLKQMQREADPRGTELLRSGDFGKVGGWKAPGKRRRPDWDRTVRGWTPPSGSNNPAVVPNTHGTVVAYYPSVPYVGQFAGEDHSIFYTATQYFTLHLYSTLHPKMPRHRKRQTSTAPGGTEEHPTPSTADTNSNHEEDWSDEDSDDEYYGRHSGPALSEDSSMKRIKRVQGMEGRWTVTDCDADRKGQKMIYSSITPYVHMLYTDEFDQEHVELNFKDPSDRNGYYSQGIWSVRFSADGKEVVAGAGGGKIMVYDLESQRRSLSVTGHQEDVNAVCFADESSTNILVSGSDDGYIKIWDRRSLSSHTPSGVLVGATEGITYTSPKGDGRYIVANSKDQAARLYDLRKMRSASEFGNQDPVQMYGANGFDYRDSRYPLPRPRSHPQDCSVMTYRGHSVLRTLIRCHFSPLESTGQSYIYSGSADGMVHIWSLDGKVVQVLDRTQSEPLRSPTSPNTYSDPSAPFTPPQSPSNPMSAYSTGHTVRDVAWHRYEPTLMSTCWEHSNGYRRGGTVAKHEWKGLGKGGLERLEDWVEKKREEEGEMV
ncbi:hypothetical protein IAT38_004930 [Cryptococcus sp. DSM 104549]